MVVTFNYDDSPRQVLGGTGGKMGHGFVLRILAFHAWSGNTLERKGIEPDDPAELSRAALVDRRDMQVEAARQAVREPTQLAARGGLTLCPSLKAGLRYVSLLLCCVTLLAARACGKDRIGDIEFFGYTDFAKPSQLRKELSVRVRDLVIPQTERQIRQTVKQNTFHAPTDVALICCDAHQNYTVFIGLPGPTLVSVLYYPAPKRRLHLSKDVVHIYYRLMEAMGAAVREGGSAAEEDDSRGYALTNDPSARSWELKLHDYAEGHEDELLGVLGHSSSAEQRQIAAETLGYARESRSQIMALVTATQDPDPDVRNNATRALGVLASSSPQVARHIPAGPFIEMLGSGVWTDRNKALFVLMELTKTRNPALLARLRAQALQPLIEMAKWHDVHAEPARIILGRMAGIPENQLIKEAVQSSPLPILNALRAPQ